VGSAARPAEADSLAVAARLGTNTLGRLGRLADGKASAAEHGLYRYSRRDVAYAQRCGAGGGAGGPPEGAVEAAADAADSAADGAREGAVWRYFDALRAVGLADAYHCPGSPGSRMPAQHSP
jgi:hypothetical protein